MASKCRSKTCNPSGAEGLTVTPEIIANTAELRLNNDHLQKCKELLTDNIERGLKKETHPDCALKCFPTYVQDLPDGTETGKYLALDFGGSHCRVLLVTLGGGNITQESEVFEINNDLKVGTGEALFDFLADCVKEFVTKHGVHEEELSLGFTFSFPVIQKGLKVGILEKWAKGFVLPEVIGQNVVQLLNDAFDRLGDMKVNAVASLNDTTGTLLACAFKYPLCRIGLIIGTGTNCCYVELQSKAELFDEPDNGSGKVIINMESGGFGDDGALDFIRTEYDEDVDQRTPNRRKHIHEKMISGMFLGELVRLLACKFTKQGLMFGGKASVKLETPDAFETKYVSDIESDPVGQYENVKAVCDILELEATEQDYVNLRYLCELFSTRAAFLVAAELATLIDRIGEPKTVVGVDGTLYKNHPHFRSIIMQKIAEVLDNKSLEYDLVLSEDGSGRGAAFVAAVACKS